MQPEINKIILKKESEIGESQFIYIFRTFYFFFLLLIFFVTLLSRKMVLILQFTPANHVWKSFSFLIFVDLISKTYPIILLIYIILKY